MNLTIEQMREIVAGAPEWPVIGYCLSWKNYIHEQCEHAPFSYSNLDNSWSEEYAIQFVLLKDLRAAIADHDRTDHVSDIRNHIAPTTKVIEG
ncbi:MULTISPECIES: hypothetical protein [unclassified Acinetobacter]|uniref:hypothetical protein n=1 Tax=unclassified Acinetobacter TaxID=196816 RepID=UPI0015D2FADD|nr:MULTISPECIES: hypothetical protein [unclassified Acinetobacter]